MESPPSPPLSPLTLDTFDDSSHRWRSDTKSKDQSDSNRAGGHVKGVDYSMEATPRAGMASDKRRFEIRTREMRGHGDLIKTPCTSSHMDQHSSTLDSANDSNIERIDSSEEGIEVGEDENVTNTSKTSRFTIRRQRVSTIKSKSGPENDDSTNSLVIKKANTPGTLDDDSLADQQMDDASLREMGENCQYALEVGLIFSADDGDTIANENLYSQSICGSLTMDESTCGPPSDLSVYLHQHRNTRHIPYHGQSIGSKSLDSRDSPDNNYIRNPNYVVERPNHFHPYFANDDYSKDSTVRDDHGNRVPQNAKSILGYKKSEKKQASNTNPPPNNLTASQQQRIHNNQVFPHIHKTFTDDAHSRQEMEKRLRDIAGQLSTDWRSGPAAFIASPALARRLRDFQFAREKRRKKYGKMKPWGILGLYDHLAGVRVDVEWAEDAARRRTDGKAYMTWADFEARKNSGNNRPFFTFFVVSMCTALMFASWFVNGWKFEPISVNPMIGPSAETLIILGAKDSYLIVQESEIWRLASPMVLHAGLIHYALNMFVLWYVGKAIELIHGHFQAMVQFVIPAVGGTILSALFLPEYITVGASGGIFGLIGACLSDIFMNWNLLFNQFVNERGARISHARVLLVLLLDIILNCLLGITPFVDNFTHLGGMIYGFLCGLSTIQIVSPRFFGDERRCAHKAKLFFFRFFGLILSIAGIIVSSVYLFSGDGETNPCSSCRYMSCISFPPWQHEKWWYCDDCSETTAEGTLNTATGKMIELNMTCPSGFVEYVQVDELWPQDELELEAMLPTLCRERCL